LVGMRMRLGAGAGRHAHQPDDHAVALDAGAVGGRIIGAAQDVIHLGEVEHVFALASAFGAGRASGRRWLSHQRSSTWSFVGPLRHANSRAEVLSPAASNARARPPRMAAWSLAGTERPRTCSTPSGMPMSKG